MNRRTAICSAGLALGGTGSVNANHRSIPSAWSTARSRRWNCKGEEAAVLCSIQRRSMFGMFGSNATATHDDSSGSRDAEPQRCLGQISPQTHPHLFFEGTTTATPPIDSTTSALGSPFVTVGVNADDYRRRRDVLFSMMPPGSIIVLSGALKRVRTHDINYPFRQDSNMFHLVGLDEPGAAAVFVKPVADCDPTRFILFGAEQTKEKQLWEGVVHSGREALQKVFGADEAYDVADFAARFRLVYDEHQERCLFKFGRLPVVFHNMGVNVPVSQAVVNQIRSGATSAHKRHASEVAAKRSKATTSTGTAKGGSPKPSDKATEEARLQPYRRDGHHFDPANIKPEAYDLSTIFTEYRTIKDAPTQRMLQRSADITADAFVAAMAYTEPGRTEWQVSNEMEYVMRNQHASGHAYIPVVAGGTNALCLHYIENLATLRDGDLLLVDAGAEFHNYPADCTRTWPVNGRFTQPQRDLYELVLHVQERMIEECFVDGANCRGRHLDAVASAIMAPELQKMKIIPPGSTNCDAVFQHALGHFMGIDIHEKINHSAVSSLVQHGRFYPPSVPNSGVDVNALRTQNDEAVFVPGMVHTVEPGLYIPLTQDYPAEYRGLGIRIEDNVIIQRSVPGSATVVKPHVTTARVPKTVADVEAACAAPQGRARH